MRLTVHRASTTSAVLATLDEKLAELANRTITSKQVKAVYEKQYQSTLKEVVDKQKEARNASRAAIPTGRTNLTAAGVAERDREREREREREERERKEREKNENKDEDKDSMDVDEPADAKGKGRK